MPGPVGQRKGEREKAEADQRAEGRIEAAVERQVRLLRRGTLEGRQDANNPAQQEDDRQQQTNGHEQEFQGREGGRVMPHDEGRRRAAEEQDAEQRNRSA